MAVPRISILVPTYNGASSYNGAQYLGPLCESLLAQTFTDFEVVVMDDGSSQPELTRDAMAPFLKDPRFRLRMAAENRGLHRTRCALYQEIRGEYWCAPDSDDLLHPEFLARRVEVMEEDPHAAFIHGKVCLIDPEGNPLDSEQFANNNLNIPPILYGRRAVETFLQHNYVIHSSAFGRSSILRQVLPFYTGSWRFGEDWPLWILLAATGYHIRYDDRTLTSYRILQNSLSRSIDTAARRRLYVATIPFCTLSLATSYSAVAGELSRKWRSVHYALWLKRALGVLGHKNATLRNETFSLVKTAFYGPRGGGGGFWWEVIRYSLPILYLSLFKRTPKGRDSFAVSGLAAIGDPLFFSPRPHEG